MFPEVEVYRYVTEQTFDAYLYQLVESKQKFISQIMTSKSPVRSAEDVDEVALSFAEVKMLATGDERFKEKMDLDMQVSKLKVLKQSYLSQHYELEDRVLQHFPKEIKELEQLISAYGCDVPLLEQHKPKGEDRFCPMTLQGVTYTEKADAGFPMHPHRGIETISYVSRGKMVHRDSLGNEAGISDGEVQWMNSGSGIMHEEMVPAAERLLGVQLWLNLPAKDKMSKPSYNSIKNEDIKEIEIEGGKIRLLAGKYGEHEGYKGDYLSMDYYDIHLNADAEVTLTMEEDDSVMVFTLLGDVYIDGEHIEEKTAVKLTEGDSLTIKNGNEKAQVLYMNSRALNEPVAWAGPIVMNTQEELQKAFLELRSNTFIKETAEY